MLVLRFLVGLGVRRSVAETNALVAECWPGAKRPLASGAMMAGLNAGILMLSQLAHLAGDGGIMALDILFGRRTALLGVLVLVALPESPRWLATVGIAKARSTPLRDLFSADLIRFTLVGIAVAAIPMIGAWSASKWMIPWADQVAGKEARDRGGYARLLGVWCSNWQLRGSTTGHMFGTPPKLY